MVAPNEPRVPTIQDITPALIRAAAGYRYKETVTTTVTRDGDVVEETTEVWDKYMPADPSAALALFRIGESAFKDLLP